MFRFESSYYLNLFWLIPVFIFLYVTLNRYYNSKIKSYFKEEIYLSLTKNISIAKRTWKFIFEILVLSFIVFALARPQMGESTEKIKVEGIELIIAMDVSNSMLAEDLKPARIEVAKNVIEKMLVRFSGYKVGLIAFAGSAALVSPLTTDYSAINTFLETISPDTIQTQGTNIRATLKAAYEAFNRGGVDSDEFTKVTKVIVILSDGEDHEGGAIKDAEDLIKKGVRIFTVGVGTEQGAPVPSRDDFGQLKGYKKDSSGNTVLSKVNTNFLRQLASAGKGAYFHATFSGDEVFEIEKELNKLEKSEFDSEFMKKYDERFQIPLLLALFFLIIELLLNDIKIVKAKEM